MNHRSGINPFSRRVFIQSAASAGLAFCAGINVSLAGNPVNKRLHGLSSFGDLKYPADYSQFSYARPDAPKGGKFVFQPSYWYFNQNVQTFNTLNSFVLKGEAPPRMELCFDKLMVWAIDEPDALYCALAHSVEISTDRNSYVFELRREARFHDGSKITAYDVAFSYDLIKQKGHPLLAQDLRNLDAAIAHDDQTLELRFNGKQSDRAILSVANEVPIFSREYYQANEFTKSTMNIPLSSGPWRVGKLSSGRYIEYDRVKDYWAKDLPFAKGLNHFDQIRIEFYRERIAGFEAFKKGEILWREEFTSKTWATSYDFPAVNSGKVVKQKFSGERRPAMQGWAMNTRLKKFSNLKTRQAIGLCFDFEWTNKNLFYGAYQRSHSLFEKSEFRAHGEPSIGELALLEPLRAQLPQSVFGEPVMQPVTNGSGRDRKKFLRQASQLFAQAGWKPKAGRLLDENGKWFEIEFLIRSPVFERVLGGFVKSLKQLGIDATIRLVDPTQYQKRTESFDFDITASAVSLAANPTQESLSHFFHSLSAKRNGSYNLPGVEIGAVDKLVESMRDTNSRDELVTHMRALDRVLRAYHFWIPNWYSSDHRVAMWDMFGWPEPKPDFHFPVEQIWWRDEAKAKKIGKA